MGIDKSGKLFQRSPLDHALLNLQDEELSFFKMATGIENDDDLKEHIVQVQAEAYNAFPYPCIRRFLFTNLQISHHSVYDHVLRLGQVRDRAILLDVGCCFGNDIRKVIADGYPMENIVALDLRKEFWDLGHRLFKSTPATFPVPFVNGDIFEDTILRPSLPSRVAPTTPAPPLISLGNSLNSLCHHVSVIHVSAVFHLFSEEQQLQLARKLSILLSPVPGSIILGSHVGLPVAGIKTNACGGVKEMYCHSPESWRFMWEDMVFDNGSVHVRAALFDGVEMPTERRFEEQGPDNPERWRSTQWLRWSVERV